MEILLIGVLIMAVPLIIMVGVASWRERQYEKEA